MRVTASTGGEISTSKCKGVGKAFRRKIPFEEYKKCIDAIAGHRVQYYAIQSKNHVIKTMRMDKQSFSSFDDKRHILPCGIHTVPYGSFVIDAIKSVNICPFPH